TDPNTLAAATSNLPGTYNYKQPTGNNHDNNNDNDNSGGGKGGGGTGGGKDSGGSEGGGKSGGGSGSEGGGKGGGEGGGKSGGGSGSEGGGKGGGSGSGGGNGGGANPSGHPGPPIGPSGPISPGIGGGGASGSQDLLRLFSEALQLISSGIPTLVQLGNQLAAQLGPALQALAKSVEDGTTTVKQALAQATERFGEEVHHVEELLFPPGATGPIELPRALFPGLAVPDLGASNRAGGRQPEVFEDFTSTRSTTEVGGDTASTGSPGHTVEGNQ
ncbi:hypothetical protein AB0M22_44115, partial [Nocardia sp. NPDC051756]|uniref:hypothetical protein n=1 Tax=Nocardia sp. NPDC051756 TaxID=3154751 RepID=UPI003421F31C